MHFRGYRTLDAILGDEVYATVFDSVDRSHGTAIRGRGREFGGEYMRK